MAWFLEMHGLFGFLNLQVKISEDTIVRGKGNWEKINMKGVSLCSFLSDYKRGTWGGRFIPSQMAMVY
jgi:hypothetical protein